MWEDVPQCGRVSLVWEGVDAMDKYTTTVFLESILRYNYIPTT